jgi:hypothetical protein
MYSVTGPWRKRRASSAYNYRCDRDHSSILTIPSNYPQCIKFALLTVFQRPTRVTTMLRQIDDRKDTIGALIVEVDRAIENFFDV